MFRIFALLLLLTAQTSHAEKWGNTELRSWKSGDWRITIQDYGKSIGKNCYLLGEGINTEGATTNLWIYPTGEGVGAFSKRAELVALAIDVGLADIKSYETQSDDVVAMFLGDYKSTYRVGSQGFYAKLKGQENPSMFVVKAKNRDGQFVSMTFSSDGLLSARDFLLDKCW